jgi:hypothetical protein
MAKNVNMVTERTTEADSPAIKAKTHKSKTMNIAFKNFP